MKDFLLVAYDLFKVINNDDGEVIITEDQPEENTDSMPADQKVSYFHQFSFRFLPKFHPFVHALGTLDYLR